jgi:hypothetical protein
LYIATLPFSILSLRHLCLAHRPYLSTYIQHTVAFFWAFTYFFLRATRLLAFVRRGYRQCIAWSCVCCPHHASEPFQLSRIARVCDDEEVVRGSEHHWSAEDGGTRGGAYICSSNHHIAPRCALGAKVICLSCIAIAIFFFVLPMKRGLVWGGKEVRL